VPPTAIEVRLGGWVDAAVQAYQRRGSADTGLQAEFRSAAQSIEESGREVGDARNRVVEDRRASGDGAVGLAERPTVLSWRDGTLAGRATVVGARDVDRRHSGRGRGRQRLVDEGRGDRRDDDEQAGGTDPADPNATARWSC